jgi:hypothetical protein
MDFFNYSMPGLCSLSLHGCRLHDAHLDLVLEGLAVNSSLRSLALSCNAVTDAGLVALLEAVGRNRRSCLAVLDLRHNLVAGGRGARAALSTLNATLSAPSPSGKQPGAQGQGQGQGQAGPESDDPRLEVFLAWNLLTRPWPDSDSPTARKGMSLFVHTSDDALPNHSPVLRPPPSPSSSSSSSSLLGAGAGLGRGGGGSTGKKGVKGMLSRATGTCSPPPAAPPAPASSSFSASASAQGSAPPPTPGRFFSLHFELGPGPRPSQRIKKKPKTDTTLSPSRFLKVLDVSHPLS